MKRYEKHRAFGSSLYWTYREILKRCYNPNHKNFKHYGGRGITVCDEWRQSFLAFKRDVGDRPGNLTLDRKDNDGNYEPGNVRWATQQEQQNNRRNNRFVPGTNKTVSQMARELGIPKQTYRDRLDRQP